MTTALVLSGVTNEAAVADASVSPDYVLDDLGDIDRVIG